MVQLKIYINLEPIYGPWGGGGQFNTNLIKFLEEKKHKIVYRFEKHIDLIIIVWNMSYQYNEKIAPIFKYKKKNPNTKILHRINASDISKNTKNEDKLIFKINKIADETVFISNWLADYFIKKGFNKSYNVIYNGCNTQFFFPLEKKELGSTISLVTHHYSNNWMKGFDIYNKIDEAINNNKDIKFTYIGNYYPNSITKNINILSPLYGMVLGNELRKHDIYVTASRWEAGGMHHIEGASCGLPVLYHAEGGGINESCKNYGIEYNNIPSLFKAIDTIRNNYKYFVNKIPYEYLSSRRVNEEFYKIIMRMFDL